jgi:hypothetical protein
MFAHDLNWDSDLVCERCSLRRIQLQLAMYAMHLFTGHSLLHKRIKLATIKEYVRSVALFLRLFGLAHDPRYDSAGDKAMGEILTKVYRDMQQYEELPRKREPFTPAMVDLALQLAAADDRPDGLLAALADWYIVGLNAGLRKSEWAQADRGSWRLTDYQLDIFGNARAFTLNDISIEDTQRKRY